MSFQSISLSTLLGALVLLLLSCEKVVQIDLNSANPKTVIEANLQEGTHLFEVRVYQTKDYFGDAPNIKFDDAMVTLGDSTGESVSLLPAGDGRYTAEVTAMAGRIYTLEVSRNGEIFTASSRLPERTEMETIGFKEFNLPGEDNSQQVFVRYNDRADVRNFYRMIVTVNDSLEQELQYFDDKYTNGNKVEWPLQNFYEIGDHLKIEMRSIDEAAYKYYFTLAPILSGNTDTAPGNPISNWKGGALGYFIAYNPSWIEGTVE